MILISYSFYFLSFPIILIVVTVTNQVTPNATPHKTSNFLKSLTPIASFSTTKSIELGKPSLADAVTSIEPSVTPNDEENGSGQKAVILIFSVVLILVFLVVGTAGIIVICMVARKRCGRRGHLEHKVVSKSSIDNPVYDAKVLTESRDYAVPVNMNPAYSLHVHSTRQDQAIANDYEACRPGPVEYLKPVTLFRAIPGFAKTVKSKDLRVPNDRTVSTGSVIYETPLTPVSLQTEGARECTEHRHYELAVNVPSHSDHEAITHNSGSNTSVALSPGYEVPLHSLGNEHCSATPSNTEFDTISNASNHDTREDVKSWVCQNGSGASLNKI